MHSYPVVSDPHKRDGDEFHLRPPRLDFDVGSYVVDVGLAGRVESFDFAEVVFVVVTDVAEDGVVAAGVGMGVEEVDVG